MVEKLSELSKRCQKPNYKTVGNWMVRNILRDAALPVSWLLLHTPVTANQVTLAALLIGVAGGFFLGGVGTAFFATGVILLQLWYYLDHVDGQIARYRGTASLTGRFFDFVMHHLIHSVLFFFLFVHVYRVTHGWAWLFWGFAVSQSVVMLNLIHDAKSKAFIEKMTSSVAVEVKLLSEAPDKKGRESLFKIGFSAAHKLCEVHVVMNILTFCALLEIFLFRGVSLRVILAAVYAVIVPAVAVTKTAYFILKKKADEEFDRCFTAR